MQYTQLHHVFSGWFMHRKVWSAVSPRWRPITRRCLGSHLAAGRLCHSKSAVHSKFRISWPGLKAGPAKNLWWCPFGLQDKSKKGTGLQRFFAIAGILV